MKDLPWSGWTCGGADGWSKSEGAPGTAMVGLRSSSQLYEARCSKSVILVSSAGKICSSVSRFSSAIIGASVSGMFFLWNPLAPPRPLEAAVKDEALGERLLLGLPRPAPGA